MRFLGSLPRLGLSLRAETLVLHPVRRQRVLGHADPMLIDLQAVRVLEHLDFFPLAPRHPVVVPLEGNISIFIRAPLVRPVGRGKLRREFDQVAALVLKGFGGNQAALARRAVVHADRGPLEPLGVQVLQALEAAARQKVGLDGPKTALLAGFSVCMADLVAGEVEAVALGEGGHLRPRSPPVCRCPATGPGSCCR